MALTFTKEQMAQLSEVLDANLDQKLQSLENREDNGILRARLNMLETQVRWNYIEIVNYPLNRPLEPSEILQRMCERISTGFTNEALISTNFVDRPKSTNVVETRNIVAESSNPSQAERFTECAQVLSESKNGFMALCNDTDVNIFTETSLFPERGNLYKIAGFRAFFTSDASYRAGEDAVFISLFATSTASSFATICGYDSRGNVPDSEGVSDHCMVELQFTIGAPTKSKRLTEVKRVDFDPIKTSLLEIDWTKALGGMSTDEMADSVCAECLSTIEECTSTITMSRRFLPVKELVTPGLVRSIRKRKKLYKRLRIHLTVAARIEYESYKKVLSRLIRKVKNEFFKKELDDTAVDPRRTWRVITAFFRGNEGGRHLNTEMVRTTANDINSHFAEICPESICGEHLADPMLMLIRKIFDSAQFPRCFKRAHLFPIHKSGPLSDILNYRPISLLPVLREGVEKVIASQLSDYLAINGLLDDEQFGFRRNRSCEDAARLLAEHTTSAREKDVMSIAIVCDLSRAFDTVNIERLINKLETLGVRGGAPRLFRSYLDAREQFFRSDNFLSESAPLTCGVPQGSILGFLIFICYMNDLFNNGLVASEVKTIVFANDTVLLFEGSDIHQLYLEASYGISKVLNWMNTNGLLLNIKKTKFMRLGGGGRGLRRCSAHTNFVILFNAPPPDLKQCISRNKRKVTKKIKVAFLEEEPCNLDVISE
ncbi:uncharacterized protein LOC108865187 [Galendromus occidentalis]|uniref:Uncharacterized protein LOC108864277 n=1 Tax=Galendromus occidentalis TaxID=34638 RepID=A0AAJ7L6M3_9ACAR|nr:uncharacterized protein LOC108864277 [Galendromus occidentalis]XP_018497478.1 uncharacterized protein LOC108865187 [Galendromus occidentalis]